VLIIPCAWGFQPTGYNHHQLYINQPSSLFWRCCWATKNKKKLPRQLSAKKSIKHFLALLPGRKQKTSARGVFRTHILYFVLLFCFTLFLLALFYTKNPKN
jgi:hypothetical protein